MSLQIGAALKTGGHRLVSRTGAIVTLGYLLVYVIYQSGFNVVMNALYARMGVETAVAEPIPMPTPVAAAVVFVCLLALTYVTVVAIRVFVAGERDAIPSSPTVSRGPSSTSSSAAWCSCSSSPSDWSC